MSAQTEIKRGARAADMVIELEIGPGNLDGFLEVVGEERGPRIKYLEGRLTLLSPSEDHERAADRLDALIKGVCVVLGIGYRAYGSTLFRRPGLDHGIEPDKSYYVQNCDSVKGREIDLEIDPPPDLVVEIVVSHGAAKAMAICRGLRVPEVWVYHVRPPRLEIFHRKTTGKRAGNYAPADASLALPFLRPDEVATWLSEGEEDDGAFDRRLREWVRSELAPRFLPGGGEA
jgi:Uma2 family endonuclease